MATPQEIIIEIKALRVEARTYERQATALNNLISAKKVLLETVQTGIKETSSEIDKKFKELRSLI